jgi:transposase-like protein
VDWPRTPVEQLPAFRPPFCPWAACPEHARTGPGYRFRRHGSYATAVRSAVPRYRCQTCRRTFSRQTFSLTYYLKRPALLGSVAAQLVGGSAHRQIARTCRCAPSTVTALSARLGRHSMLLHARARSRLTGRLTEPIVLDHFETFEFSQDLPFSIATPVGAQSWYSYDLDPVPHDRTGRRSTFQQARLDQRPHRPHHGGIHGSTRRIVDLLLQLARPGSTLQLDTDGHAAYHDVVTHHPERSRIRLSSYPNPDRGPKGAPRSPAARLRDRALFPVDLWHALLRHSCAHYHRETIAFGRRLNALLDRTYLTLIWRNFVKGRSERKPDPATPAMKLQLTSEPWTWRHVLARRLFPARQHITPTESTLYRREWFTPVLPNNRTHTLRHAF